MMLGLTLSEEDHHAALRSWPWFGGTASVQEIQQAVMKSKLKVARAASTIVQLLGVK